MKDDTQALSQRLMVHTKTAETDALKVSPINAMNQHQVPIKKRTHMWVDHFCVSHRENEGRSFHRKKHNSYLT